MDQETYDFIREECEMDEWSDDDNIVAICDYCGREIRRGGEMLSALDADGNPVRLCYFCTEGSRDRIPLVDFLELLGLWGRYDDDAEEGESVLTAVCARRRAMLRGLRV